MPNKNQTTSESPSCDTACSASSYTPETDTNERNDHPFELCCGVVSADFARDLERDRNNAREEAAHWKAQCRRGFNVAQLIQDRNQLMLALAYAKETMFAIKDCTVGPLVMSLCDQRIELIDEAMNRISSSLPNVPALAQPDDHNKPSNT